MTTFFAFLNRVILIVWTRPDLLTFVSRPIIMNLNRYERFLQGMIAAATFVLRQTYHVWSLILLFRIYFEKGGIVFENLKKTTRNHSRGSDDDLDDLCRGRQRVGAGRR